MMSPKPELTALTGIRFFAASYVLFFHAGFVFIRHIFPEFYPFYAAFAGGGSLGVDLFFILSGFILAYNYEEQFNRFDYKLYLNFLYKRLARVYPIHLFTLLVLALFVLQVVASADFAQHPYAPQYTFKDFLANIFLVHAWSIPISYSWNNVSWSISAEWFAYLLFPLLVIVTKNIRSRKALLWTMALLYIAFLVVMLGVRIVAEHSGRDLGMVRIFFEFFIGIQLFKLYAFNRTPLVLKPVKPGPGHLLAGALLMVTFCIEFAYIWAVPIFAWVILRSARNQWLYNRLFFHPWVVYGGKISYALYMVHGLLFMLFFLYIPEAALSSFGATAGALLVLAYIIVSYVAAAAIYHYVELPSRKLMLSFLRTKKSLESTVPSKI
jgi:peptidoglycan/LPS O-acetylase OafA/YrhL